MANKAFKRVALMGRRRASKIPETVIAIRDFLKTLNVDIVVEKHTALAIEETELPVVDAKQLHKHADIIILIGGDGSLINAAHVATPQNLPVLGINRGRLGFLTDIYPDELDKIKAVLAGHYRKEDRFLLDACLTTGEQTRHRLALNDIVLTLGKSMSMIEFAVEVNDQPMYSIRADGLIIATPTGSTAYALSAGGPILAPELDAIVLVPMFPHSLSNRPIVIPADSTVKITIADDVESAPTFSCDGQQRFLIKAGSSFSVHKNKNKLTLIHPDDYNYFATLSEKFGWHRTFNRG